MRLSMVMPKYFGAPCSEPDCKRPASTHGMCQMHYSRVWRKKRAAAKAKEGVKA